MLTGRNGAEMLGVRNKRRMFEDIRERRDGLRLKSLATRYLIEDILYSSLSLIVRIKRSINNYVYSIRMNRNCVMHKGREKSAGDCVGWVLDLLSKFQHSQATLNVKNEGLTVAALSKSLVGEGDLAIKGIVMAELFCFVFFSCVVLSFLNQRYLVEPAAIANHHLGLRKLGSGLYGLGIGTLGLDWSTISSYLGSPLASPWFATANVAAGFKQAAGDMGAKQSNFSCRGGKLCMASWCIGTDRISKGVVESAGGGAVDGGGLPAAASAVHCPGLVHVVEEAGERHKRYTRREEGAEGAGRRDLKANGNNSSSANQNQGQLDLYGMQRTEMWDPHMGGMYPGGEGMMGPRGRGVMGMQRGGLMSNSSRQNLRTEQDDLNDINEMLSKKTYKESQRSKTGEELLDLIQRPTAKETAVAKMFRSQGGSRVKEYCSSLTKEDCRLKSGSFTACEKVHFRRIIAPHTDINLGDCSFLDTCRHMKTCKYVHYELDTERDLPPTMMGGAGLPPRPLKPQRPEYCSEVELGEPQWINCDIRTFRMDILGQFGVIMADPPWDIHMELPYGTMADDEMRNLNVPALQTDGLIFLWVTGRAMELGRECLETWGYKRVEEIIWVKTNQLQRIIRTGRTGHWLNHSKEHCLVGLKGDPEVNRNIDTDVIVAEVRETSRKPDEMYPMLERISPKTRKLELFARMHNTHAGWMSLGNQLEGVRLVDEGLRARFKAAYPDVAVQPSSPPRASAMEIDSNPAQARSPFAVAEPKSSTPQFAESAAPEVAYASEERSMAVDGDMAN
ncbi:hypothetical protein JRO89_XS13G0138600 [Xanthoceras sorbifolium]|uniref:N6-adenosine-methyltransferase MT-A70-like n=1 Tax=Xanthoceras sorbifolium TaxID=99658 RepID=A0ABQ8H894_9ROSI|nr:hypothetical protein JRO89_XS13G0138600 [Xanthoceras sorbifolium]